MSQIPKQSARVLFKLANAWQIQGKYQLAYERYQQVIDIQPDFMPAYQQLGNLMLQQQEVERAIEYYDRALALDFDNTDLSYLYQWTGISSYQRSLEKSKEYICASSAISQNDTWTTGKIKLQSQRIYRYHRSGWKYAIQALSPLNNSNGILFDGFIEDLFLFQQNHIKDRPIRVVEKMRCDGVLEEDSLSPVEKGIIPYREPWIGFLHNPQNMPTWFLYSNSPQSLFKKETWQESIKCCEGLFALSDYHANWLREQTGLPVSSLIHPTEIPETIFSFPDFRANSKKKIVQIGWWLRKSISLYQLPITRDNPLGYEKILLSGKIFSGFEKLWKSIQDYEMEYYKVENQDECWSNTRALGYLENRKYDELLAQNIIFIDMHDSSANNAVIECIARATPLLVNPLPAVREYLGKDYPMYFETLEEAATKAMDTALIYDTHLYLLECETRKKLSAEYFLKSFRESEVYRLI